MNDEKIEELFNYVNYIEDKISEIKDKNLRNYIAKCILCDEYVTIEDYKEFKKEEF